MCGRYTLTSSGQSISKIFQLLAEPDVSPQYNMAPTQPLPCIRHDPQQGGRRLDLLRWGLIPSWSRDDKGAARMINARCETVTEKPAFRKAFKMRRCLIPANGFYEWKKLGGIKQPYYFSMFDQRLFAFAGLWENWLHPEGYPVETFTILTTEANQVLEPVHHRMPVILDQGDHARWLDTEFHDTNRLASLLRPYDPKSMTRHPVTRRVGSPAYDTPDCIIPEPEPSEEKPAQGELF